MLDLSPEGANIEIFFPLEPGNRGDIIPPMNIVLRQPRMTDIDCFHDIFSDKETHHFIIDEGQQDKSGSHNKLKKLIGINGKIKKIYTIESSEVPVGFVVIHLDESKMPFISYAIRRKFWRKGFAAKAITELLNHEKSNFEGFKAATHIENEASQNLLLKCDFNKIGLKDLEMGERVLFNYKY